uniref:Uncharacterized protein n=1 Tax=Arundo donax TaxID=35708 RepID=A0A0A8ZVW9_ARUDO
MHTEKYHSHLIAIQASTEEWVKLIRLCYIPNPNATYSIKDPHRFA